VSVTFNGTSKLIIVDDDVTELTVKEMYSAWKDWVLTDDNSKYAQAFAAIGGDSLPGGRFLGTTYFLENGWKIRPYEGNHVFTLIGNLYDRGGGNPFVSTVGEFNVLINLTTSNLVDTISTGGSSGSVTNTDIQNIASNTATRVWDKAVSQITTANTIGTHVKDKLLQKTQFLGLKD
jgi:hypothetical protein